MTEEPNSQLDADVIYYAHRMFELARNGFTEELVENLKVGLPANLTNDNGDTLLILSAYNAHPETMKVLLEAGADHARVNDKGQTALGAAVFRKSDEGIALLLDAGADPKLGSPSAIEVATFFELPEQLELLQR